MKPQPPVAAHTVGTYHHPDDEDGKRPFYWAMGPEGFSRAVILPDWTMPCPYGAPGDRLWVRETLSCTYVHGTWYTADESMLTINDQRADKLAAHYGSPFFENEEKRIPSIHMPRWASRITLELTGVRVERLQEISEDDAKAEGVVTDYDALNVLGIENYRASFEALWDSINGDPIISRDDEGNEISRAHVNWAANPWVWVIEFKRLTA